MDTPTYSVTVRHSFEAAHRLPHLGGKCTNLHGHSWQVEVTVTAPTMSRQQTVVEFGAFKRLVRTWIDDHLDHGAMLGIDDPIAEFLAEYGKTYVFGHDWDGSGWPTVEAVAELIAHQAGAILGDLSTRPETAAGARVSRVRVAETAVNAAVWTAP